MTRNITDSLLEILKEIDENGEVIIARGQEQREVLSKLTKIERPYERFLVLPGRNNNVFAQIAETAWVLAGRDDLSFLSHYLPRASDFSDDGKTWRAAYGPRIRRWGGQIDQVKEVVERLREDPFTKRAVASIFDPSSDFIETRDVPCNNVIIGCSLSSVRGSLIFMSPSARMTLSGDLAGSTSSSGAFFTKSWHVH